MRLSRSERMLGGIPGRLCWKSWNRRGPGSMSRTSKRVQRSPTSSSDFATGQAWPYRLGTSRVYRRLDRKASLYKIASHMDPATRRLLDGPIAPTLLRLAAPNVVMLVAQVAISILEAYYVGWLGADALAGVSVTFPLVMLMQTMSAGGMGGGVASAVARALGAGRRPRRGRVLHRRRARALRVPRFRAKPDPALADASLRAEPVRRDLARRRAEPRQQRHDEPDRRPAHGPGRALRHLRARGLRHGCASRVPPDPAGLRLRLRARHDGRNELRRRPADARPAGGLDRGPDRGRDHGGDRTDRRLVPARVARPLQQRARGARGGRRVPARR